MNLTVFEDSSDMEAVVQTLNTVPVSTKDGLSS